MSGLPIDVKPREIYLLFRGFKVGCAFFASSVLSRTYSTSLRHSAENAEKQGIKLKLDSTGHKTSLSESAKSSRL